MTRLTQEMVTARTRVSDMALIKKLNCWGGELKDISLLRRMTNVEVLSLSVNKISTLVDVQYCKNLKELYIRKNEIKNLNEICYLKNLPNLVALWLGENPCSESDPLYRMTVIKNLPTLEKLDDIRIEPEERQDAVKKGKDLVHPEMYENASNNSANNSPRSLRSPPPISSRCLDTEYEEITGNQKSYSPEYEQQQYQTSQQSHLYSSAENRYPQANDRYDSRSYQNPRRPNDILYEQSSYDNGVNASHVNLDKNSVQQTPNTSPRCADSCINNKKEYSNEPKNCYTNPEEDEVENRSEPKDGYCVCPHQYDRHTQTPLSRSRDTRRGSSSEGSGRYSPQKGHVEDDSYLHHGERNHRQYEVEGRLDYERSNRVGSISSRRPITRNSNLLSAVLCLVKELDYPSLEVVDIAVRCRMDEFDD